MKILVITLVIGCLVIISGALVYSDWQKNHMPPAPAALTQAAQTDEQAPTPADSASPSQPRPVIAQTDTASPAPSTTQTAPTDSISPAKKMADALLSAKSGKEKLALFDELRKDPQQLDAVISQLKQEAAQNPNNPEIPTTIGEAQINELRSLAENGGAVANHDQIGILAMQADQEFDTALQIDPKNWEAQFVKYSTLYYWPASPQTDNQAVQGLTSLIDQQEKMPPDPTFAQTYVVLGNQYQKMGQSDKAMATWQLGAQEFPGDSMLQKKITGTPAQ